MRRSCKMMAVLGLCLLLTPVLGIHVHAKNYYDTKFNDHRYPVPYKGKSYEPIAKLDAGEYEKYSDSLKKDFNADGTKETVKLKVNVSKNYSSATLKLSINNSVAVNKKVSGMLINVSFYTINVQKDYFGILIYGDEDYAGGGAMIYRWTGASKLTLLKTYKTNGYLYVFSGYDKALKKPVLYIQDSMQLFNMYGESWPSNVLAKYREYADREGVSVTRDHYMKFSYANSALVKKGTDNYYRVSYAYD